MSRDDKILFIGLAVCVLEAFTNALKDERDKQKLNRSTLDDKLQ